MRKIRHFLILAVLLLIFVTGTGIMLKQYKLYKSAYQELGRMISHPSIESEMFYTEEGHK
jgi:hypothetical protein